MEEWTSSEMIEFSREINRQTSSGGGLSCFHLFFDEQTTYVDALSVQVNFFVCVFEIYV